MKVTENTKKRILVTILTGIACVLLFGLILGWNQERRMLSDTEKEMKQNMEHIMDAYDQSVASNPYVRGSFVTLRSEDLSLLKYLSENDPEFEVSNDYLAAVNERLEFADICIVDRQGRIKASASGSAKSLKDARYNSLRETFDTKIVSTYYGCTGKNAWDSTHLLMTQDESDPYFLYSLYAMAFTVRYEFVIVEYGVPAIEMENALSNWLAVLENATVGTHGYTFCWSDESGELIWYPDEEKRFQDIGLLGLYEEKIEDGVFGWNMVEGEECYLYARHLADAGIWVACAQPRSEILTARLVNVYVLWGVFALLAGLVTYYVVLLLRQKKVQILMDFTKSGEAQPYISRQRRLAMFTALMVLFFALISFYLQTLVPMSDWAEESIVQLDGLEEQLKKNEENTTYFAQEVRLQKYAQIKLLTWYMQRYPSVINEDFMNAICPVLQGLDSTVFTAQGQVKTTCSDKTYRYLNVKEMTGELQRLTDESGDESANVYDWMSGGGAAFLTPMYNASGILNGYFYLRYYSDEVNIVLQNASPGSTLGRIRPGGGGCIFMVESETGKFTYFPDEALNGRVATEFGIRENQLRDNYHDFININKVMYYASTRLSGDQLLFDTIRQTQLFRMRVPTTLINSGFCLLFLILIGLTLYSSKETVEKIPPEQSEEEHAARMVSAEYKAYHVLVYYLAFLALAFASYSILRKSGAGGNVLDYVMDGSWEQGFNVFALTAAIILACEYGSLLFVFRKFVNAVANVLPFRGGTIVRMLTSLATYIGLFYIAYRCLVCFGMNPTTLMTSAGIFSVVVGIGANSLVGDIIAGIFLLAEGDIQVGDVVRVGDFRGYVQEMGIRRTKMLDMDTDDVRLIPNKGMMDAVHMSMHPSIVYSRFLIGFDEDLTRAENLLTKELAAMTGDVPYLIGEVKYLGVSKIADSGIVLFCMCHCHEAYRYRVERAINRRVYLMFKENGIEIPYPKIAIDTGAETDPAPEKPEKLSGS